MDSEIIGIIDQVYNKHKAILFIGRNWEHKWRRDSGGLYLATLRAGNVAYQHSTLTAGFTSDNPLDALRQAVAYADAHAVEGDDE